MIAPDANLLLYAYDRGSPFHEKAYAVPMTLAEASDHIRSWLARRVTEPRSFDGEYDISLSGRCQGPDNFCRIVGNPTN